MIIAGIDSSLAPSVGAGIRAMNVPVIEFRGASA